MDYRELLCRNMKVLLCLCIVWTVLDRINCVELETRMSIPVTDTNVTKSGICPRISLQEEPNCFNTESQCNSDSDCEADLKCCNNGCENAVCTYPSYTGCQQLRSLLSRHASSDEGLQTVFVPECREDGKFRDVQCSSNSGKCWCVDDLGFELAGTRENSSDLVNCSAARRCAGVLCRMLCPYGFQLDSEGCPLCKCRNPCEGVECPAGQECQLEEIPCAEDICPPLPTCKQPRSLDDLCPMGAPLSSPDNGKPFLCGLEANKPQCPPNHLCDVMPGNDYGVCCPLTDKTGICPPKLHYGESCGPSCEMDVDCGGITKCCSLEECGKTCTKPANTTLCQQQKAVVELLLSGSPGYDVYIPQCLENGEFSPKQCSANGHLCWCVTINGTIIPRTMGLKNELECEGEEKQQLAEGRTSEPTSLFECDKLDCDKQCEAGFKYNGRGCKICECAEPCKDIACPERMKCVLMKMDNCLGDDCIPVATCQDASIECTWGRPLSSNETLVNCSENDCPITHVCEMKQENGICCPKRIEIEATKPFECPTYVHEPASCDFVCYSDSQCGGDMKCCPSKTCGAVCAPPKPPKLPTMCEYIRDSGVTIHRPDGNATLAMSVPQCLPDGPFNPKQCDESEECWCVDEFGVEIINTRSTTNQDLDCVKIRDDMSCLGLICRLGCDFGFVMDEEGCPLCSCRNPCQNASCEPGKTCQFLEVDCSDDWCPPLPFCVPSESVARNFPECPMGSPMLYEYDNEPVICDPFSNYPQCPSTHDCVVDNPREMGVCCPRFKETSEPTSNKGQCPYLIPVQSGTCEYECSPQNDCHENQMCCSNGCGTQCVDPVLKTACQHQKAAAEHRAIELSIPASRVSMPNCTDDGDFADVQCSPVSQKCWCVDRSGIEIPGTRVDDKEKVTCVPETKDCGIFNCDLECPNGYEIKDCQICQCYDPCKDVKCKNPKESCRLVQLNCITEPCPPVPLCLPSLENPCPIGEPLMNDEFGNFVHCGPVGDQCPNSHRCHLSPLGEYALCCPKPIVSTCEILKKRNLQYRKLNNRVTFLPKCNRKTGAWDPTQCMESLGLCWCVDSEGNQLPGTLIRGVPHCTARSAKSIEHTPICENGKPVHICPESLCEGKVCLAHINATCLVDPCGGCKVQFVNDFSRPVNCNEGLTACFSEIQSVLNSGVFQAEDYLSGKLLPALEEVIKEISSTPPPLYPPPPPPPQVSSRLQRREASFDYNYDDLQMPSYYDYETPYFEDMDEKALQSSEQAIMVPRVQGIRIKMMSQALPMVEPMFMQPLMELIGSQPQVEMFGVSRRYTILDEGTSTIAAKPGSCPVPSLLSIVRSISQGCGDQCLTDFDCPGSSKCCLYSCGLSCMDPLIPTTTMPSSMSYKCPAVQTQFNNPFTCLFARRPCFSDENCAPNYKCCPTVCGATCVKGVQKSVSVLRPVTLRAATPRCSLEGGYSISQQQGELSWCVDQFGKPLHYTLTRGTVECDSNGTIISQIQTGPVCLDPKRIPQVCQNECMRSCPQHPEATCIADPCNDCSIKFVSFDGSPVNCEDKCKQPLLVGNCLNFIPRYYYNQSNKQCEPFFSGDCEGNDNNFETLQACEEECEREVPQCELPQEVGLCLARVFRWYYNKHSHQCEQFMYGGCGGNSNNFNSREDCERTCPDLVICPWINVNGEDLVPCSKLSACANATCPGWPEALCAVEPCSCQPTFVNKKGEPITCLPEEPKVSEESSASLRTTTLAKYTRCESLMKHHLQVGDSTYIPQCNEEGQFYPVQCSEGEKRQCWCVDEAGMQLPSTSTFPKGTKTCKFVKVKKVEVTLAFKHDEQSYSETMKPAIKRLIEQFLKDLKAESSEVFVNVLPDATNVMFTLVGDNKVQVAFQLEEMMRLENIFILLPKAEMSVDYRASHFYHVLDYNIEDEDNGISANRISGVTEARSEYHWAMFLLFTVFGCFVLFLIFYLIPLLIRKRREQKGGDEKPKPSLISMVFNNVTYGIVRKKPEDTTDKPTEAPKVTVQTVEAQYDSLQKKSDDQMSEVSEAPPAYEDVDEKDKTEKPEKH